MAEQKLTGMQIYYTVELKIFKEVTANREVNKSHVKKLIAAIKKNNLLRINPILVDRKMNVIDGQHRLEAARQLKEGIYYIIDEHISEADISTLNSNKSNWKPSDYVNYYSINKAVGFSLVTKLLNLYPWLNISACVALLSSSGSGRPAEIREGKIDVSNYNNAIEILPKIDALKDDFKFVTSGKFIRAFRKLIETGLYDHDHFLKKLEMNKRAFVQCATTKQYLEMIEEFYNKNLHEQHKIYFTRIIK